MILTRKNKNKDQFRCLIVARQKNNYNQLMSKSWADTLTLGKYILKNRVFMSALTRTRTNLDGIPNDLMVKYYTQRAGAGLIFTEAAAYSPRG